LRSWVATIATAAVYHVGTLYCKYQRASVRQRDGTPIATAGPNSADPATILRAVEPAFLVAAAFAAIGAAFSALPD